MDTITHENNHQRQHLFDQYPVMQNRHDELFTDQGEVRDQFKQVVRFFNGLSAKTYHQHHQTAIKLFGCRSFRTTKKQDYSLMINELSF